MDLACQHVEFSRFSLKLIIIIIMTQPLQMYQLQQRLC